MQNIAIHTELPSEDSTIKKKKKKKKKRKKGKKAHDDGSGGCVTRRLKGCAEVNSLSFVLDTHSLYTRAPAVPLPTNHFYVLCASRTNGFISLGGGAGGGGGGGGVFYFCFFAFLKNISM